MTEITRIRIYSIARDKRGKGNKSGMMRIFSKAFWMLLSPVTLALLPWSDAYKSTVSCK